jgi:hypothetical protein
MSWFIHCTLPFIDWIILAQIRVQLCALVSTESHKRRGIYWLADGLQASQEDPCSMELVRYRVSPLKVIGRILGSYLPSEILSMHKAQIKVMSFGTTHCTRN